MSLRSHLVMWFGGLFIAIFVSTMFVSYIFHVRSHYDALDQILLTSGSYAAAETSFEDGQAHVTETRNPLGVALRLYDAEGNLLEQSPGITAVPLSDPQAVAVSSGNHAYGALVDLVPVLITHSPHSEEGVFDLIVTEEQRWRVYVQPIYRGGEVQAYVETLTPLGELDHAIARFRTRMIQLSLLGLLAILVGSWFVSRRAVYPIGLMIRTAEAITHSRDFSQRVTVPNRQDELGNLANVFNQMLESLESAYRTQQRFIADASHELRAPLTAIQGNLELLRRHPNLPPEERSDVISEAERESVRLTRLVTDLLTLARADTGLPIRHETVELDALVLETFQQAKQLAKGQALVLNDLEPISVTGDRDRLKQLILILLDNALKYTQAEGKVTLQLQKTGGFAEITVNDTGVGIPAEAIPHVFERFFRADPARARDPGGTGLGLPIALWITQQHHGEIHLGSKSNEGTTVQIKLPLAL